jgi:hypothetical protein
VNTVRLQSRIEDALADALSAFTGDAKPEYGAWIRHISPIMVDALKRKRAAGEFPTNIIDVLRSEADEKAEQLQIKATSSGYRSPGDIAVSVLMTIPHFLSTVHL